MNKFKSNTEYTVYSLVKDDERIAVIKGANSSENFLFFDTFEELMKWFIEFFGSICFAGIYLGISNNQIYVVTDFEDKDYIQIYHLDNKQVKEVENKVRELAEDTVSYL